MSIKCGGSDATSGMASNCVIGYVADKVVDLGGTVIFGETTEFIGAEHILARRAVNKEVGDRIFNIERMFNKAAGMKPEDDRLPKRLLQEPISNGPSKGMVSKLDVTLPQYYAARGWVNAFPTDETLKKLGLDECVGK